MPARAETWQEEKVGATHARLGGREILARGVGLRRAAPLHWDGVRGAEAHLAAGLQCGEGDKAAPFLPPCAKKGSRCPRRVVGSSTGMDGEHGRVPHSTPALAGPLRKRCAGGLGTGTLHPHGVRVRPACTGPARLRPRCCGVGRTGVKAQVWEG